MKLAIMLILVCNFQLLANHVYSQNKVTLNLRSANFKQVVSEIEKKTSYRFIFSERKYPTGKYSDLNVVDKDVPSLINQLLAGTPFTYQLLPNNLIAIVSKETTEKNSPDIADIVISGVVTSETGEPLQGVSVGIVGTTNGTQTGPDGSFQLSVPANSTLRFSFIG